MTDPKPDSVNDSPPEGEITFRALKECLELISDLPDTKIGLLNIYLGFVPTEDGGLIEHAGPRAETNANTFLTNLEKVQAKFIELGWLLEVFNGSNSEQPPKLSLSEDLSDMEALIGDLSRHYSILSYVEVHLEKIKAKFGSRLIKGEQIDIFAEVKSSGVFGVCKGTIKAISRYGGIILEGNPNEEYYLLS